MYKDIFNILFLIEFQVFSLPLFLILVFKKGQKIEPPNYNSYELDFNFWENSRMYY